MILITSHYRSEGPRQGSCGVFGGVSILSGVLYYKGVAAVCEQNFKTYFVFLSFLRFGYLTHKALRLSSCFFNLLSLVTFSSGKGHKITP